MSGLETTIKNKQVRSEIAQIAKKAAAETSRTVAKKVALGTQLDDNFDPDQVDDEGHDDLNETLNEERSPVSSFFTPPAAPLREEEETLPLDKGDDRDVFERGNAYMSENGVSINYTIKKNGVFEGRESAPYNMIQLQSDYGGGVYYVEARRGDRGYIVARDKFQVADPKQKTQEKVAAEAQGNLEVIAKTFAEQQDKLMNTTNQLVDKVLEKQREDQAKEEERRRKEEELRAKQEERRMQEATQNQNAFTQLLTAVLTKPAEKPVDNTQTVMTMFQQMQQSQAQQTQLMMQQMMSAIEKVTTNTTHAIEKVSENTKHMVDKLSDKLESIEKAQANKKTGILEDPLQLFNFLSDIKEKEFERGKEVGELAAGNVPEPKEKGAMEHAFEFLGKALPAFLMSQQFASPATSMQALPAPQQARLPGAPRRVEVPRPTPTAAVRPTAARPQPTVVARPAASAAPAQSQVAETSETAKIEAETQRKRTLVVNVCGKVIGESFQANKTPDLAAQAASETLPQYGVSVVEALSLVSYDDIIALVRNAGFLNDPTTAPSITNYLRSFYDYLSQLAGREPGTNS